MPLQYLQYIMKTLLRALSVLSMSFVCLLVIQRVALQPVALAQSSQTIYCPSDDMRRHVCRVDTRDGVVLVRQRSEAACVFGSTWGIGRNGIWVDRGCRADFAVGVDRLPPVAPGTTLYCASDDMRRNFCVVNTTGGVNLVRQRSEARCDLGRTWGYERNGIWVDRGCRADFQIVGIRQPPPPPPGANTNIYCASDDMRRHQCRVDTGRGVSLVRQRSKSACIFGQTWGYDRDAIWVDNGCRADFAIQYGRRHER